MFVRHERTPHKHTCTHTHTQNHVRVRAHGSLMLFSLLFLNTSDVLHVREKKYSSSHYGKPHDFSAIIVITLHCSCDNTWKFKTFVRWSNQIKHTGYNHLAYHINFWLNYSFCFIFITAAFLVTQELTNTLKLEQKWRKTILKNTNNIRFS